MTTFICYHVPAMRIGAIAVSLVLTAVLFTGCATTGASGETPRRADRVHYSDSDTDWFTSSLWSDSRPAVTKVLFTPFTIVGDAILGMADGGRMVR